MSVDSLWLAWNGLNLLEKWMSASTFHLQIQGMAMVGNSLNQKCQHNINLSTILNVCSYGYGNWCASPMHVAEDQRRITVDLSVPCGSTGSFKVCVECGVVVHSVSELKLVTCGRGRYLSSRKQNQFNFRCKFIHFEKSRLQPNFPWLAIEPAAGDVDEEFLFFF